MSSKSSSDSFDDFFYFDVNSSEGVTYARFVPPGIIDPPPPIEPEFERLGEICEPVLRLDLRAAKWFGTAAMAGLVRLHKILKQKDCQLTTVISPGNIAEIFRLMKLDKFLDVVVEEP